MKTIYIEPKEKYQKRTERKWGFLAFSLYWIIILVLIILTIKIGYEKQWKHLSFYLFIFLDMVFLVISTYLTIRFINDRQIKIFKAKNHYIIELNSKQINVEDVNYYNDHIPPYLLYKIPGKKLRRKLTFEKMDETTKTEIEEVLPINSWMSDWRLRTKDILMK